MRSVVLDAYTLSPDHDIWSFLADYGTFDVYDRTSPDEIITRCSGADVVFTNKVVLGEREFAALPDLRYVGVLATGYNVVDVHAAANRGIIVTNIPAYSTNSVAQSVFALLLEIANRVGHYAMQPMRWAQNPDFSYRDTPLMELAGKTMGIVGYGRTGSATAAIALAFGMHVVVFTSKQQSDLPAGLKKVSLDELFTQSDVVSLHCPLTPDTFHLVDAARLASMKQDAILINTSRGPVVDETALARALRDGKLLAAGMDVLSQEPPSPDNPLLAIPSAYITPHIAWATQEARLRLMEICKANLMAFLAGKSANVVS